MNSISNILLGIFFIFMGVAINFNPHLIVNKFNQPIELSSYYAIGFIVVGFIITIIFYRKLKKWHGIFFIFIKAITKIITVKLIPTYKTIKNYTSGVGFCN